MPMRSSPLLQRHRGPQKPSVQIGSMKRLQMLNKWILSRLKIPKRTRKQRPAILCQRQTLRLFCVTSANADSNRNAARLERDRPCSRHTR